MSWRRSPSERTDQRPANEVDRSLPWWFRDEPSTFGQHWLETYRFKIGCGWPSRIKSNNHLQACMSDRVSGCCGIIAQYPNGLGSDHSFVQPRGVLAKNDVYEFVEVKGFFKGEKDYWHECTGYRKAIRAKPEQHILKRRDQDG